MLLVFLILLALFSVMAGRLAYLSGGKELAQYVGVTGSRTIRVGINAARGTIRDRNGQPLVGAHAQAAVLCEPMSLSESSANLLRQHAIGITRAALDESVSSGRPFLVYVDEPITGVGLTGLTALARYEGLAQHLIGYLDSSGHGVTGIESVMDEHLYAEGYAYTAAFTADAARRALSGFGVAFEGSARPVAKGVSLSLDRQIQQICEKVADARVERGAILVSDLQSGQLCAWVSRPTYDPVQVSAYLEQGDAMLNKPLHAYCCGSVFKIVVMAAALEMGLDVSQDYECTGAYMVGDVSIACAKREGHGYLSGQAAFAQSCNPYFCQLAAQVGADRLLAMAQAFGLGQSLDLGYGLESKAGQLPQRRDLTSPVALANLAIGQGDLQVTPLQVLRMAAIVANNGCDESMHLFERIIDADGKAQNLVTSKTSRRVISEQTAAQLRDMMVETVLSGSGRPAAASVYQSAVKTSSAETGIRHEGKPLLHTWVTGFYPAESPQYAITVLVEGGSSGYESTAPVFGDIVNQLYGCGLVKPVL